MRGWNPFNLKYLNIVLVVSICDAQKHIFSIASAAMESRIKIVGLVSRPDSRSYSRHGKVINSDKQKCLLDAVSFVFPIDHHRYCLHHFSQTL